MKFKKYLATGFKLALVIALGSLILFIPRLINLFLLVLTPMVGLIIWVILIFIALILNGYLIIKFKRWIFK